MEMKIPILLSSTQNPRQGDELIYRRHIISSSQESVCVISFGPKPEFWEGSRQEDIVLLRWKLLVMVIMRFTGAEPGDGSFKRSVFSRVKCCRREGK